MAQLAARCFNWIRRIQPDVRPNVPPLDFCGHDLEDWQIFGCSWSVGCDKLRRSLRFIHSLFGKKSKIGPARTWCILPVDWDWIRWHFQIHDQSWYVHVHNPCSQSMKYCYGIVTLIMLIPDVKKAGTAVDSFLSDGPFSQTN